MKHLLASPAEDSALNAHKSATLQTVLSTGTEAVCGQLYQQNPRDAEHCTRSSPSTHSSSFSAWQRTQAARMRVSELEGSISQARLLPCVSTGTQGSSSKQEVNWNKRFITRNKPVTSPKCHELYSLGCVWGLVTTWQGCFWMTSLPSGSVRGNLSLNTQLVHPCHRKISTSV